MVAARSGYVKGGVPVRTPLFLCAFFFPALSLPRLFVPLRPFCSACLPLPEGGGCSSGKVRHTSGKGKSLDCQKRKGTALVGEDKALVRVGDRSVVMGREVARSEEERGPLGKGRPARQRREGRLVGRNPVRCGTVRPVGEGTRLPGLPCVVHFRRKGCLRSRIGGPNDTNRIKNTRFGLPFNEKFGMFVHMNRIRLAEVTLIGHATGSLSGTCAGRGTGGENIWCFMSPAR